MKNIQFIILGLFLSTQLNAQYLNEIGFFIGGANYSGDFGRETYIAPNTLGGNIVYKRNMNSRVSLRGTLGVYQLADNDAFSSNIVRQRRGYSFNSLLTEVALGLEFSYWDYDITSTYHSHTPYILVEFAGIYYNSTGNQAHGTMDYSTSNYGLAIPVGVGYKGKITEQFGYAIELRSQYTFKDDIDYYDTNNLDLNSQNINSNDWYFFTGASLIYSFQRPPCSVPLQY